MQEALAPVVRIFVNMAILVVVAGAISIGVGLYFRDMPKRKKMATINLVFALVMVVGAFFILF